MEIQSLLSGFFEVQELPDGAQKVKTPILVIGNQTFYFFVEETDDCIRISDRRLVCAFLSKLFDIRSPDVKNCFHDVLKINKVGLQKGEVFVIAENESQFLEMLGRFLVAVCQLLKMQVFFEMP